MSVISLYFFFTKIEHEPKIKYFNDFPKFIPIIYVCVFLEVYVLYFYKEYKNKLSIATRYRL